MAIPAWPTFDDVIREALSQALTSEPTAGEITSFRRTHAQTIKNEMWSICATDPLLRSAIIVPVAAGQRVVPLPNHVAQIDNVTLLRDVQPTTRSIASATASTVTFQDDLPARASGAWIVLATGLAAGSYRTIVSVSGPTVTVEPAWANIPGVGDQALVTIGTSEPLLPFDERERLPSLVSVPISYWIQRWESLDQTPVLSLAPIPDQPVAVRIVYGADLTRLDEEGDLFRQHLNARRALWVRGLTAAAMLRYDEARYPSEYAIFQQIAQRYRAQVPMSAIAVGRR